MCRAPAGCAVGGAGRGDSQDTALSLGQWEKGNESLQAQRHEGRGAAGGANPEIGHINRLCTEQAEGRGAALKIRHRALTQLSLRVKYLGVGLSCFGGGIRHLQRETTQNVLAHCELQ